MSLTKGFTGFYLDWRELAEQTMKMEVENPGRRESGYAGMAVTGMGGSGIVGDVIQVLSWEHLNIPVIVVKDFNIPRFVGRDWLVLSISYSGNTIETLSTVKEAMERGCDLAAISSGGKLEELARKHGITYVKVESGRVPRASMPALLVGALRLLEVKGIKLPGLSQKGLEMLDRTENALKEAADLAEGFLGRIPVFVSDTRHYPLAVRGKNEFNENAKMVSKVEVLPEWGHNDIVGWEKWLGPLAAVVFELGDNDRLMRFAANYLKEAGVPVKEVIMDSSLNYVDRILYYSLVIGLASLKVASERGVDPSVTKSIVKYKSFLKSWRGRTGEA